MTQEAPPFALGRVVTAPDPFPADLDLAAYLRRHLTGDWGIYPRPAGADLEDSFSVISLYCTPSYGWLMINTANSPADGQIETCCLLVGPSWDAPLDGLRLGMV